MASDLAKEVARHSVEHGPMPCFYGAVDPMVRHMLEEQADRFLEHVIPVLKAHGWTEPE